MNDILHADLNIFQYNIYDPSRWSRGGLIFLYDWCLLSMCYHKIVFFVVSHLMFDSIEEIWKTSKQRFIW